MATGRVTAETVNALQPGAKDYFLWDDKVPGFGIKVTPKGAKVYLLQYRLGGRGHKTKRYTIGNGEALKAQAARRIAEELYGDVRKGKDIAAVRREERRVAVDLAFKPFVKDFCDTTLKAEWPKSWKQTQSCLELHAVRHWNDKPLPSISAYDVRQLLRKLDKHPATKRNLFAALSYLFNRAKREGLIASSPLETVEPPSAVAERTRALKEDELRWLWSALQDEGAPYGLVVEDLLLLAQRRGEVAGLPWAELDRKQREWHLPASRAKNGCENVIPLTDRAVAKLDKLAGGEKWPRSGLVYPSREKTPLSGWSKLKRRLDKAMAAKAGEAGAILEPWKLHDLRRTVATHLQRLGFAFEVIEHLLNHKEKSRTGIAAVYQTHGFKAEKLAALQAWERELFRIIEGGEQGNVLPFARPA
jgi:integrase